MAGTKAQTRLAHAVAVVATFATLGGVGSAAFGYTIRTGDTVSALAHRFGVTPRDLVRVNHLADPNRIYAGQSLIIPTPTGAAVPPIPATETSEARPTVSEPPQETTTSVVTASGPTTTALPPDPRSPGPLVPVTTPAPGPPTYPKDLLVHPSRLALVPVFRRWATAYGLSPGLLESVAWMESGWQTTAVSPTGAIGICQIEPATAAFISSQLLSSPTTLDSTVADANIHMAAAYLAVLLRDANGDVATALGGYYQGLIDLVAKGPRVSTRRYVTGVGALWAQFRSG